MTEQQKPNAILFLDFDGTISRRDAVDAILETYADPRWLTLEADWRAGRIGSRVCLQAQMALVRATRQQIETLLAEIEVDEGFVGLLAMCSLHNVPVYIVSDGFDFCVTRILARAPNANTMVIGGVCAAHLELYGHVWRTEFPFFHQSCAHGCATCKPAVMRLLNNTNAPVVFVGDGLSDRYAVESADLVFAKNELAAHCRANSIPHDSYQNLAEVAAQLERWLVSHRFLTAERKTCASA